MCEGQHNTNIICIELAEGLVFVDSGRQDDIALELQTNILHFYGCFLKNKFKDVL